MYKQGDKVIFKVGKESFKYIVSKTDQYTWFLSLPTDINSIIFKKLNIVDRFKFVRDISKYVIDDRSKAFPEIAYPDETEINKVIYALLEKCNEYNKLHPDSTGISKVINKLIRYLDGVEKFLFEDIQKK